MPRMLARPVRVRAVVIMLGLLLLLFWILLAVGATCADRVIARTNGGRS